MSYSHHLSDYKPQIVLGYGKFSTVIKAKTKTYPDGSGGPSASSNENHACCVAIKIITKSDTIKKINKILPISSSSTNYDNEIRIIRKLSFYDHPNILRYFTILQSQTSVYIVQEMSPLGELNPSNFKYPNPADERAGQSIEPTIIQRLLDMVSSISFLHSLNIIHRDIKPSNFLLFHNGLVKLTDFDTCYTLTDDPIEDKHQLYSKLIGTPLFLPPELLTHSSAVSSKPVNNSKFSNFTKKFKLRNSHKFSKPQSDYNPFMLDLWSLGVTLHYLFYSVYPFYADNEFTLLHQIATVKPNTPSLSTLSFHIDNTTLPISTIISNLLVKDPNNRLTISDIYTQLHIIQPNLNTKLRKKTQCAVDLYPTLSSDLSISDLCDSSDENTDDINNNKELTNRMKPASNINNVSQALKFQLPIFMSPKDVISSQWGDLNDSQKLVPKKFVSAPTSNPNNLNNSTTSLPLNGKKIDVKGQNDAILANTKNKLTSSKKLSAKDSNPHSNSNINDYAFIMNKMDKLNIGQETGSIKSPTSLGVLINESSSVDNNRSSVHTLPANFNLKSVKGSQRGLKHSEMMNFKKFKEDTENKIDAQVANNYKLYTMDDYLEKL